MTDLNNLHINLNSLLQKFHFPIENEQLGNSFQRQPQTCFQVAVFAVYFDNIFSFVI